jgi:hypothetical protein
MPFCELMTLSSLQGPVSTIGYCIIPEPRQRESLNHFESAVYQRMRPKSSEEEIGYKFEEERSKDTPPTHRIGQRLEAGDMIIIEKSDAMRPAE